MYKTSPSQLTDEYVQISVYIKRAPGEEYKARIERFRVCSNTFQLFERETFRMGIMNRFSNRASIKHVQKGDRGICHGGVRV